MSVNAITQADILPQLQQRRADWQNRYGVTRIGIFGSVARGEATPDRLQRVRLKTGLESLFGKSVDVIRDRPTMPPYRKTRIDQEVRYV